MSEKLRTPDYIFESSWEVCNKVGGIYTVLSTRAKTLQKKFKDRVFFIGPDVWKYKPNPLFIEDDNLCKAWREHAYKKDDLKVRVGRWNIPGKPITVLVDFEQFYLEKNHIYGKMWEYFQVDSLHAYGDYDEASMFSFAAGKVVESFYNYCLSYDDDVIYQAHEWMTGMGLLYIQKKIPRIGTIFTTHATSIGRSIAGNNKPLYEYLSAYNGDQMARELNMESKHSIEKQTAHYADCFTTVSDITDIECKELLDKKADEILMNGFENDFVPSPKIYEKKRGIARKRIFDIASSLTGKNFDDNTLIIATSGRYEFKNKGIDVFIHAMNKLNYSKELNRNVIALITVPAWMKEARTDLMERLNDSSKPSTPLEKPFITHWLNNMDEDKALSLFNQIGINNDKNSKVNFVFIPCYLDGEDKIVNLPYYDLMPAFDLTVYPSYYEPWGYTPLESVAFGIPTITTDLAGFGLWANSLKEGYSELADGVKVIHRNDFNYSEAEDVIMDTILRFSSLSEQEISKIRENAFALAKNALWKHFIEYYYKAYDIALNKADRDL